MNRRRSRQTNKKESMSISKNRYREATRKQKEFIQNDARQNRRTNQASRMYETTRPKNICGTYKNRTMRTNHHIKKRKQERKHGGGNNSRKESVSGKTKENDS